MFGELQRARILLLGGPCGGDLARAVQTVCPAAQVEAVEVAPRAWLRRLDGDPQAALLVCSDGLPLSVLQFLGELLAARPQLLAVLLVGSRGLAGAEGLLALANVRLLPEPWTPAALRQLLGAGAGTTEPQADRRAPAPVPEPRDGLPEGQDAVRQELAAARALLAELCDLVRQESRQKSDLVRSQAIELASLRSVLRGQREQEAAEPLLHGLLQHRDRLAALLQDTPEPAARARLAAVLRTLDEFLATQGVTAEEHPDPGDAALARVIGRRSRGPSDPPSAWIVRKPAYVRTQQGARRVLRPAEIEILDPKPAGG